MLEIQIKCNPYFVRLEELSWDTSLRVYYDLLRFLNIEGEELLAGLKLFCKHALGIPVLLRTQLAEFKSYCLIILISMLKMNFCVNLEKTPLSLKNLCQ